MRCPVADKILRSFNYPLIFPRKADQACRLPFVILESQGDYFLEVRWELVQVHRKPDFFFKVEVWAQFSDRHLLQIDDHLTLLGVETIPTELWPDDEDFMRVQGRHQRSIHIDGCRNIQFLPPARWFVGSVVVGICKPLDGPELVQVLIIPTTYV